ncbi:MAG: signal peptidase I [Lachnospiraceae bacterium]|nr:signal peptidase I [Lachnospiraceae bacterium]
MARKRVLEQYNGRKLEWLHDWVFFAALVAAVFILFRFIIGTSVVSGDSMLPSLQDGNLVVYTRIVPEYRPGDVISVRVPSGDYYVKRVIAVGGDEVDLVGGRVYVNGEMLEEPWADGETLEETGSVIYPYTVREGNVFVLGDNRSVSMDSRAFGEVNRRQIKGKILIAAGSGGIRKIR